MPKQVKKTKPSTNQTKTKNLKDSLLSYLPESIEHLDVVKQVAHVIEEMEDRAKDVKQEAQRELKKLMSRYSSNYKTLEKKLHKVTAEAKKQAQMNVMQLAQKWHESKEKLPASLSNKIENLIGQISSKAMKMKKSKDKVQKKKAASAKKSAGSAKKTPKTTKTQI